MKYSEWILAHHYYYYFVENNVSLSSISISFSNSNMFSMPYWANVFRNQIQKWDMNKFKMMKNEWVFELRHFSQLTHSEIIKICINILGMSRWNYTRYAINRLTIFFDWIRKTNSSYINDKYTDLNGIYKMSDEYAHTDLTLDWIWHMWLAYAQTSAITYRIQTDTLGFGLCSTRFWIGYRCIVHMYTCLNMALQMWMSRVHMYVCISSVRQPLFAYWIKWLHSRARSAYHNLNSCKSQLKATVPIQMFNTKYALHSFVSHILSPPFIHLMKSEIWRVNFLTNSFSKKKQYFCWCFWCCLHHRDRVWLLFASVASNIVRGFVFWTVVK